MKKANKIPVPFETLKNWQLNYRTGDQVIISKRYSLSKYSVCIAFKGQATPHVMNIINEYYRSRKSEQIRMKGKWSFDFS